MVDDGVSYEADAMTTQVTRDAAFYSGVRLSVPSRIDRARWFYASMSVSEIL